MIVTINFKGEFTQETLLRIKSSGLSTNYTLVPGSKVKFTVPPKRMNLDMDVIRSLIGIFDGFQMVGDVITVESKDAFSEVVSSSGDESKSTFADKIKGAVGGKHK